MKAVFFDLDDTLLWDSKCIKEAFETTCTIAADKIGIDPETIEKHVRNKARTIYAEYDVYPFTKMIGINPFEGLWGTFHDGTLEFPELERIAPEYQIRVWTESLQELGMNDGHLGKTLAGIFKETRQQLAYLYPDTLDVLRHLKEEYRLVLITNGAPTLQNQKLTSAHELPPFFEKIVISGDFGKGKPDPALFEYVLSETGLNHKEAVMVGDNLNADIKGANAVGMKSIWINHHGAAAPGDNQPTYEVKRLKDVLSILRHLKDTSHRSSMSPEQEY
ncbi:putative hydrolase of the HAD superfamily [Scopulibacillus daqui]|uniref:Phosphoserine phosphatase n=1 Tax=Scopulibacillus daqui TaxID=1469162 RepID=A0ABS2Q1P4_9BACL|nr:HAD family hydrolase [Scopulibacillus daqui]MBM7646213.1 putative hydrolase of the HAD superfamily [Scopulibacillus daqui]